LITLIALTFTKEVYLSENLFAFLLAASVWDKYLAIFARAAQKQVSTIVVRF
jgi:hypothetical protein